MPTRLLLEGPSIEDLLAQVRAEHGENARIVQADKVRSGGFAGFFAKEVYEVAIEVDDLAVGTGDVPRGAAPADILSLVDDADAADEGGLAVLGFSRPRSTSRPAISAPVLPVPPTSVPARDSVPALRSGLAGRSVTAAEDDSPLVSTSSDTFARVLAALSRDMEELPERTFAPAPFVSPENAAPIEAEALTARAAFEAVVAGADVAEPAEPRAHPMAEAPESLDESVEPTARRSPAALQQLLAAGVPAALLAGMPDDLSLEAAARRVADALTPAAPAAGGAGSILVIVGEGRSAYAAARSLATGMGLRPDAVLLAAGTTLGLAVPAERHLRSRRDAARAVPLLRARCAPVVVAVDAGVGRLAAEAALDIVESLAADTTWMLADATRKIGTVRAAADALSGLVDAVVLHHATQTTTPAEVLGLNLPVALVDEDLATPERWTRLLVDAVAREEGEL